MIKNKVLITSFLGIVLFSVATFISMKGMCLSDLVCSRPHDDSLSLILLPTIPLFIFSLVTYKMREKVFQAWWNFARIWIPISMLAILLSPSSTHNWMFPIEKGSVVFFSSILFILVSVILIIIWQIKEKKNSK